MSMSSGGDGHGMMAEINVTPFVDVMLVLLIIFMVTTPLMVQGLEVDLPRASAPPLDAEDDPLILAIDAQGRFYINKTEIPSDEMEKRLVAIARENPDQNVFLKADGEVSYSSVAKLMADAKRAGIAKVGLVTQPGAGMD